MVRPGEVVVRFDDAWMVVFWLDGKRGRSWGFRGDPVWMVVKKLFPPGRDRSRLVEIGKLSGRPGVWFCIGDGLRGRIGWLFSSQFLLPVSPPVAFFFILHVLFSPFVVCCGVNIYGDEGKDDDGFGSGQCKSSRNLVCFCRVVYCSRTWFLQRSGVVVLARFFSERKVMGEEKLVISV